MSLGCEDFVEYFTEGGTLRGRHGLLQPGLHDIGKALVRLARVWNAAVEVGCAAGAEVLIYIEQIRAVIRKSQRRIFLDGKLDSFLPNN